MIFGGKGPGLVVGLVFVSSLQANAVLSTGALNCTFGLADASSSDCGPGGTNFAAVGQLPQLSNGIAGVVYSMSSILTDTSAGTNSPFTTTVTLSSAGVPTGTGVSPIVSIPMEWEFALSFGAVQGHTQINSWTLTYDLQDVTAGNVSLFSSLPTITSGPLAIHTITPTTFAGAQTFNLTSPITPGNLDTLKQTVILTINWTGQQNQADNLAIQFLTHGLDFNDESIPEPSTLGLSGGALALLIFFARRKQRI